MNPTDDKLRQEITKTINENPKTREELEAAFGKVWDTKDLQQDFQVQGFLAPLVVVVRKSDGKKGTLFFQHLPRFYFDFELE